MCALLVLCAAVLAVAGAPSAAAAAPSPSFPRLAIWWPDSDRQPVSARARCDWTALQGYDVGHIAELRAANPDIIVLGSTNARELNYGLTGSAWDQRLNAELRSASTDWMLTQAGSTLKADVSDTAISIPLVDTARFAAGQMVLVDEELMRVTSVHASSLTVQRGQVTTVASHRSGARIAPVVSNWPGSITMDLSTGCPRRDVGHGPETWSDWDVRRGLAVLDSGDWDGLLTDCLEGDPSWMVTVGNVRSIDENRDNKPDDLSDFNAIWNPGAQAYGDALKAGANGRIVVGNGNLRDYNLNGTVFETFPKASMPTSEWRRDFLGVIDYPWASYPEWCANAAGPNLTLIQTYGAQTDFRMMRYGLCTALMNDGYYSYARSDEVHARGTPFWFDEYDDAGFGRGYLGLPTGPCARVGSTLVSRRDFTGGIALVNPTSSAVTVKLGGIFRRIKGVQDPKVNSGGIVTAVTIPARDGRVLLRVPVLGASAKAVQYGSQTTLTVTVAFCSAVPLRVDERVVGSARWTQAATMTTDAQGVAVLCVAPGHSTDYRVVRLDRPAPSNLVTVGVRRAVTASPSSASVRSGRTIIVRGAVAPSGRVSVTLQRRVGGSWRRVRSGRASSSGHFAMSVTVSGHGVVLYRVVVAADRSHLAAHSRSVEVYAR